MRLDGYRGRHSLVGLSAHCANSYIPHVQHIIQYICAHVCVVLCSSSPMPVLPFAHLALYRFCNLPLFQVFLENPSLIMPFCMILCQSYIPLPFLNGFYTPRYIGLLQVYYRISGNAQVGYVHNQPTKGCFVVLKECNKKESL